MRRPEQVITGTWIVTEHGRWRARRQNLEAWQIDYVVEYGWEHRASGAAFCCLRKKDIPRRDLRNTEIAKLEGTTLVLGVDRPTLITCYRDVTGGLAAIRRKPRYSRGEDIRQARLEAAKLRDGLLAPA